MLQVFRPRVSWVAPQLFRRQQVKAPAPSLFDPATEQQVTIGTLSVLSPLFGNDPEVTTGDFWILPLVTSPGGYAITANTDGTFSYDAAGDETKQQISTKVYDDSEGEYFETDEPGDYFTIYVNNAEWQQLSSIPAQQWYTFIPITPLIYADYGGDPDDLDESLTYTGPLVSGTVRELVTYNPGTPSARTVWQISGTPTVAGSYVLATSVEDPPGARVDLSNISVTVTQSVQIPVTASNSYLTVENTLSDFGLITTITEELSAVAAGGVIRTVPAAGTYVVPGSSVDIVVSAIEGPDVIGLTQSAAETLLDSLTLVSEVQTTDSGGAAGTVVSAIVNIPEQPDLSGYLLLPGAEVILTVVEEDETAMHYLPVDRTTAINRKIRTVIC